MPHKTQEQEPSLAEAVAWILDPQRQQAINDLLFALQSHPKERATVWALNRYAKHCAQQLTVSKRDQ